MKRSCRDCGMCCTLLRIEALDKDAGVRCKHLKGTRCSIYSERPDPCRAYRCAWLQGAEVPKPSKAGFIADGAKAADLILHMGNRTTRKGSRFITECNDKGMVIILAHKDDRQLVGPPERVMPILRKVAGNQLPPPEKKS